MKLEYFELLTVNVRNFYFTSMHSFAAEVVSSKQTWSTKAAELESNAFRNKNIFKGINLAIMYKGLH